MEIEGNIIKQGKRNGISQRLHAKSDKEKVAAWGSDLDKMLQVFNVRSVASITTVAKSPLSGDACSQDRSSRSCSQP